MSKPSAPVATIHEMLHDACARNIPAELHYEDRNGIAVTGRVRLLELTEEFILADQPLYADGSGPIPAKAPLLFHVSIGGTRHQFDSAIIESSHPVRLNNRQWLRGIAMRLPRSVAESQRRSHLRVSLASQERVVVNLARPDPNHPGACLLDPGPIVGSIVDVSIGGASILVERSKLRHVDHGEVFFAEFTLPIEDEEFQMSVLARHVRVVESSDSLRIGFVFRPWRATQFQQDQRRISKFIAAYQRLSLKRRR